MIDPDFFGCSGKLTFDETRLLASAKGGSAVTGDFSEISSVGRIVTSIDRIHRCAKDWGQFARIALSHAFADVVCAGGIPIQAMLSFEFGIDVTRSEWLECSIAFERELAARGISLGKCHSSHGFGVTAVTVATLAKAPEAAGPDLRQGRIYLSRPLGAFKLHYLAEMGIDVAESPLTEILEAGCDHTFHGSPWSFVTDVSGHGLLGALAQTGGIHDLNIDLELSEKHAILPEIFTIPVGCLQNPSSSYGIEIGSPDEKAEILATLRETAGPFLGFVEDDVVKSYGQFPGLPLGRYHKGSGEIYISWIE